MRVSIIISRKLLRQLMHCSDENVKMAPATNLVTKPVTSVTTILGVVTNPETSVTTILCVVTNPVLWPVPKYFFFVAHDHLAINYGFSPIYVGIYGQKLVAMTSTVNYSACAVATHTCFVRAKVASTTNERKVWARNKNEEKNCCCRIAFKNIFFFHLNLSAVSNK